MSFVAHVNHLVSAGVDPCPSGICSLPASNLVRSTSCPDRPYSIKSTRLGAVGCELRCMFALLGIRWIWTSRRTITRRRVDILQRLNNASLLRPKPDVHLPPTSGKLSTRIIRIQSPAASREYITSWQGEPSLKTGVESNPVPVISTLRKRVERF